MQNVPGLPKSAIHDVALTIADTVAPMGIHGHILGIGAKAPAESLGNELRRTRLHRRTAGIDHRQYHLHDAYLQKTYADHTSVVIDAIEKVLAGHLPRFNREQRQAFAANPGEARLPKGFAKDVRDEIIKVLASRLDSDANRLTIPKITRSILMA